MVRVTYSLDEATVEQIRRTAARLRHAQSQVVRDAVAEYAARTDRLSDRERTRLLDVLARVRQDAPTTSADQVDAELRAVRAARRRGGRRHPAS
jgi:hypothetical protein